MKYFILILLATPSLCWSDANTAFKITKEDLLGKKDVQKNNLFIKVESLYTDKPNIFMRTEAYNSFKLLHAAAAKDGFKLNIVSANRDFKYQKGIWEAKWKNKKYKTLSALNKTIDILKYSSMPGSSRHHWGTDIDLNSLEPSYFSTGQGKKLYDWLSKNSAKYGFHQPYTNKDKGRTGFNEEKWHWSFLPLAKIFLQNYNEQISYADLTGFAGSDQAAEAKIIEDYVNGINPDLKK